MNQQDKIDIGPELSQIKTFTVGMDPRDKGWTIGNSNVIRENHNSFARQDPFTIDEEDQKGGKDDDVFHFIGYVPFNGQLYELDGLQNGPISFGECNEENWLSLAREQIQKRIQKYSETEIRFNLLALTENKKERAEKDSERIKSIQAYLTESLQGQAMAPAAYQDEIDNKWSKQSAEEKQASITALEAELQEAQARVASETERHSRWKTENERRRHNYVPLIFELLHQLGKKDMLQGLLDDAVKKKKEKQEKSKEEKK